MAPKRRPRPPLALPVPGLSADLAALRTQKGLSQSALAAATGIDQSEISRIERGIGNPTRETLDRLGRALGTRLGFGSAAPPAASSRKAASSYSTGGGGVRFEYLVGAHFLIALLLDRTPAPLWEMSRLTAVRFQQRAEGAQLDDVVLVASGPKDDARLVEVAVRHRPKFTATDKKFVALLADCLRSIRQHRAEFDRDRRRLCIVVSQGTPRTADVRRLTDTARSHPAAAFAAAVADKTNATVRSCKDGLRNALAGAQKIIDPNDAAPSEQEFVRLLAALHVISLDLEGASARDRIAMVNDVVPAVAGDDHAMAASLVGHIVDLAAGWIAAGAAIDERLLRRALSDEFELARSPRHPSAWALLERLSERVEAAIRAELPHGFHLERSVVHDSLVAALAAPAPLLITGEPGTGKSAACQAAARAGKGPVLFLALRDLPATMIDFESQLGCGLSEALAGAQGGGRPVLVVDGAEVALENRDAFMRGLLSSIPIGSGGWQVCLVSRIEGSRKLRDLTRQLWPQEKLAIAQIPGLDDTELAQVAAAFPQLRHLLTQPRARWLLRRPKLLDLVLQQGMEAFLERDLICEADLMDAVWTAEVRLGDVMGTPKGSPDGREQAMLALARAHLRGEPIQDVKVSEPAAQTGLRADGLLRGGGGTRVERGPVDFAHDVIRDFAVAEALLQSTDLAKPLLETGAPRWSLRACRLVCQARLGEPADAALEGRFGSLDTMFSAVAARSGERWSEVPWEALVTMADPKRAIQTLWPRLVQESADGIVRLLDVLKRRFTTPGGVVDTTIWQPVLEPVLGSFDDLPDVVLEEVDAATVSLLRSGAISALQLEAVFAEDSVTRPSGIEPLRKEVIELARRYLLARVRPDGKTPRGFRRNSDALRGLALLGPGIDVEVKQALTDCAAAHPHDLQEVVEDPLIVRRLGESDPDLLLSLAEAYYIDKSPRDRWGGISPMDHRVRNHKTGHIGFPFANWYYGPFFMLLRTRPSEAITFLNRLFDHAARAGVAILSGPRGAGAADGLQGVKLRMLDLDETEYNGDAHVYYWYRGTALGPHPCVSALLALEKFIDQLIDQGVPLKDIGRWLLRDAHSLAMLGLWVGVLVRHIDRVTDELDALLSTPAIWELEATRVAADMGGFRAHQPTVSHGDDRRAWTFTQVAGYLALNHGAARVDQLRQVREALLAAPGDDAAKRNWASQLDRSTYRAQSVADGILITQHPPADIAAELERQQEPGRQFMELNRMSFAYGRIDAPEIDREQLRKDLALVRGFEAKQPDAPEDRALDAIAATAAAAIRCHFDNTLPLSPDDLTWCATITVEFAQAAPDRSSRFGVIPEERWEMGWDRAAAGALPVLLYELPELEGLDRALTALSQSPYHETQKTFAAALSSFWAKPCRRTIAEGCVHERAFASIVEMAAAVGLGPWDQKLQRFPRKRLADPVVESLRSCPGNKVNFTSMAGAAVALNACAMSGSCMAPKSEELVNAFIDLHARAWVSWASRQGYVDTQQMEPVNAVVATRILAGDDELLKRTLAAFSENSALTAALLEALTAVAGTAEHQGRLTGLWPGLMDRLIPTLDATSRRRQHHGHEALVEALLPIPPSGTSPAAWPYAPVIRDQVSALIESRRGDDSLVNRLTRYLEPQPPTQQSVYGLDWFLALIVGQESYLAGRTYLPRWLRKMRDDGAATLPIERAKWQRLVDALAAAGDPSAVRLQQEEE